MFHYEHNNELWLVNIFLHAEITTFTIPEYSRYPRIILLHSATVNQFVGDNRVVREIRDSVASGTSSATATRMRRGADEDRELIQSAPAEAGWRHDGHVTERMDGSSGGHV